MENRNKIINEINFSRDTKELFSKLVKIEKHLKSSVEDSELIFKVIKTKLNLFKKKV